MEFRDLDIIILLAIGVLYFLRFRRNNIQSKVKKHEEILKNSER